LEPSTGGRLLGPVGMTLSFWITVGALTDLALKIRFFDFRKSSPLARLKGLPRSELGKTVAHLGFGFLIFGISAVTA